MWRYAIFTAVFTAERGGDLDFLAEDGGWGVTEVPVPLPPTALLSTASLWCGSSTGSPSASLHMPLGCGGCSGLQEASSDCLPVLRGDVPERGNDAGLLHMGTFYLFKERVLALAGLAQ